MNYGYTNCFSFLSVLVVSRNSNLERLLQMQESQNTFIYLQSTFARIKTKPHLKSNGISCHQWRTKIGYIHFLYICINFTGFICSTVFKFCVQQLGFKLKLSHTLSLTAEIVIYVITAKDPVVTGMVDTESVL